MDLGATLVSMGWLAIVLGPRMLAWFVGLCLAIVYRDQLGVSARAMAAGCVLELMRLGAEVLIWPFVTMVLMDQLSVDTLSLILGAKGLLGVVAVLVGHSLVLTAVFGWRGEPTDGAS